MKLLLHVCCTPCLSGTRLALDKWTETQYKNTEIKEMDLTCYWYNPNIHPYTEYKARLDALKEYAEKNGVNLVVHDEYSLVEFTKNVIDNLEQRCAYCYSSRLDNAARYAADNGYDAFSSSLFVSPYQNHEQMREAGEKYSHIYGAKFFYIDARAEFREGQKLARENGVYIQKYCGCIFSEQERYIKREKNKNAKHILHSPT